MQRRTRSPLVLEPLEHRWAPAVLLQLDGAGNLTGIFGTPDGDVDLTFTADAEVNVMEAGNDLGTYAVAGNLTVDLGNVIAATALNVSMNAFSLPGNLRATLGNSLGGYSVNIFGDGGGTIEGNLAIRTGAGPDTVDIGSGITVEGNVNVATGASADTMNVNAGAIFEGNLTGRDINTFELFDTASVAGNVSLTTLDGLSASFFFDGNTMTGNSVIGGHLVMQTGNSGAPGDLFDLQGTVLGNVIANMGGGPNTVTLNATGVVGGSVLITGGNSVDDVVFASTGGAGAVVLGNVTVNLKGGTNSFDIDADTFIGGTAIIYLGGNGLDTLTYGGTAPGARLTALLYGGADTFFLDSLLLGSMYIDFGTGIDSLSTNLATPVVINIPTTFRNLP